jgi:hypothetical protein
MNPARRALEQRYTQIALEGRQRSDHRGQRRFQGSCRAGEAPVSTIRTKVCIAPSLSMAHHYCKK